MRALFTFADPPTEHQVTLSTESSASSYGQPVVVTADGEAIDRFSWAGHRILEATAEERAAFLAAGYPCVDYQPMPEEHETDRTLRQIREAHATAWTLCEALDGLEVAYREQAEYCGESRVQRAAFVEATRDAAEELRGAMEAWTDTEVLMQALMGPHGLGAASHE